MEVVSDTSENLLRLCFTTKTRSRDFAIVYSYLLLSRLLELRQETSLKNKLIDKSYYNQYKYHSSLEMLLSTLPYQTINDIAEKAMFNNGICNFLWMTNIISRDDPDQVAFYKISKEFDVAIMLHDKTNVKCFNNCLNFEPWIVRILKLDGKFYPCSINEQAYFPRDISIFSYPYLLPNKAKFLKFTENESKQLFSVFSSAFENISSFLDKERCFQLVKSLNELKNISKNERESAYSIIKSINLGGSCCKHKLACFECGKVHCEDCYLNHPNNSEYICLCGQRSSIILDKTVLDKAMMENPVIKSDNKIQDIPTEKSIEKNIEKNIEKKSSSIVKNENLPGESTENIKMSSPQQKTNINIENTTVEPILSKNSSSGGSKPPPMRNAGASSDKVIKKENTLPQMGNKSPFDMNRRQNSDSLTSSNDTNNTRRNDFQNSSLSNTSSKQTSFSMSSDYIENNKGIQGRHSEPYHNERINTEYCSNTGTNNLKLTFSCWVCSNIYDINAVYIMNCQNHYICHKCILYTGDFCSICNNYFCRKCMHTILLNDSYVVNDGENNYHAGCVSGL